jgi:hypothetical protein
MTTARGEDEEQIMVLDIMVMLGVAAKRGTRGVWRVSRAS